MIYEVANSGEQLSSEWPDLIIEECAEWPQVAQKQAFFPHDVILMSADQLACIAHINSAIVLHIMRHCSNDECTKS